MLSGRVAGAGPAHRRLAEGGKWPTGEDEELDAILEQCLDMEEELARGRVSFLLPPTEEQLDAALSQSTTFSPWTHEAISSSEFEQHQPPAAATIQAPLSSWNLAYEEIQRSSATHLTHAGGVDDRVTSTTRSTVDVASLSVFGEGTSASSVLPSLSPDSWLDQIPSIIETEEIEFALPPIRLEDVIFGDLTTSTTASVHLAAERFRVEDEPGPSQSADREEDRDMLGEELLGADEEGSEEEVPQPSVVDLTSADLGDGSGSGTDHSFNENHPFIRLPLVSPVLALPNFEPMLGRPILASYASTEMLLTIRYLFTKESLTAADAELLAASVRSLVRFACFRLGRHVSTKKQSHLIRHLGLSFLVLDAVVCSLTLLGVDMSSAAWWDEFILSFPTNYTASKPWRDNSEKAWHNYKLVKALLTALEIYKTGVRPRAQDVLRLKRMLLCSQHAVSHFKGSRWNRWRLDDKEFREAHEMASESSFEYSETDEEEEED
ncbi:hypothetical protein Emed_006503 [Eimeria media]